MGVIPMPLRDTLQYSSKGVGKLYHKFFVVVDLHSHIRWQAIKPYIEVRGKNVEIGGLMSFEFVKMLKIHGNQQLWNCI